MAALRVCLIALALTAPVWALHATTVSACTCGSTWASVADAEIVAVGTVIDMRLAGGLTDGSTTPDYRGIEVVSEIAVEEYIQGSGGSSLLVHSENAVRIGPGDEFSVSRGPQPDCSYGLRLGGRYLVFFADTNEEYWTSACSGNVREIRPNDALVDVRQFLQKPTLEPTIETTPETTQQAQPTVVEFPESGLGRGDSDRASAWPIALAASGALISLSGVAILLNQRRRPS